MITLPPYLLYTIAVVLSFAISMYAVKKVMFIMKVRKIYDLPDDTRKIHGLGIPSLGGIGIFTGFMITAAFSLYNNIAGSHFIIASCVILFFTGVYDDLMNMRPSKKLVAQLLAAGITAYFADIRITSFHGAFGIEQVPYWVSIALTTVCCTFFINAFNFIDGIDGLACALAILSAGMLGLLFSGLMLTGTAFVAFSLLGATVGLLFYNIAPARIYMGDTGSMLLGFVIFTLSIMFINTLGSYFDSGSFGAARFENIRLVVHSAEGAVMIVMAMLFLPMYDAIRVFILRGSKGKSPLKADRAHLHYYLLDAGFTHSQSVLIIVATNIAIVLVAWLLQDVNSFLSLAAMIFVASLVSALVYIKRQRKLATA